MKISFKIFIILLFIVGCKQESALEKAINKTPIHLTIERFDKVFSVAKQTDLPKLKQTFPFMFSNKYPDSFYIKRMQDTLQKALFNATDSVFNTFEDETSQLERLYKHLKYYYPQTKIPRIVTTTSFVDYKNKVIITDTITIIALDTYLGKNHPFYAGIPKYISSNLKKDQITVDLSMAYAEDYIYPKNQKTFLDMLIYYGKLRYFNSIMLPNYSEASCLGYTQEQLDWALANEFEVWRYFIDKELLYSTDYKLASRFINPSPFSKFYLEQIDNESPGKIGQYIGLQIVKSYMKHNTVDLQTLMQLDPEELFKQSKFKPRK